MTQMPKKTVASVRSEHQISKFGTVYTEEEKEVGKEEEGGGGGAFDRHLSFFCIIT